MMKHIRNLLPCLVAGILMTQTAFAGNPDRVGEAGGTQLLINPWARSAGIGGVNMAGISGVEAMSFNVAGLFHQTRTEVALSHSLYLGGSGISINAAGLSQALGENKENVFGISILSYSFGDITRTNTQQPEQGAGTYTLSMINVALGYSHKFSDNIYGGVLVRSLSEGTPEAQASGIGLDAGIQYRTGLNDRIKFGVALRNIGPAMQYSGDALAVRSTPVNYQYSMTLEGRSANFEMPSVLHIAASYDVITTDSSGKGNVLTLAGSFASNAFSKDQVGLGAEFNIGRTLSLRSGFVYEQGIFKDATSTNTYKGPSAGLSVKLPFGKEKSKLLALDYAYRWSYNFGGTHTFGIRANL